MKRDSVVADTGLPGDSRLRALCRVFEVAGGQAALATALGISPAAVNQWIMVPPMRVLEVESITGIHRSVLRPDLYPREDDALNDDGVDVVHLLGRGDDLTGPDRAAYEETLFRSYQDALHKNAANPNLRNAGALVRAWNQFAVALGVEAA